MQTKFLWCHLIWPTLSQLPGTKSGRNSEWGGGKRKLGVCWSSLSTAGRGVMSTERDWNWLFLGLPPCPLAHIQSCIIHTLHYLRSSIFVHHSRAQLYSSHQDLWIHGLMSYTDGWETWGGWESQTELSHRIAEENGCIACCPLISPACNCAGVGVCSGCRRMRDEGVNCL